MKLFPDQFLGPDGILENVLRNCNIDRLVIVGMGKGDGFSLLCFEDWFEGDGRFELQS